MNPERGAKRPRSIRLYAMQQGGKGRILLRSVLPTCPGRQWLGPFPSMAAVNKSLAQINKSGTAGKATKKARNPANRVDPMGADHRVVSAIKEALSMLPQPWSQRAMLTSNDYKELAARCTELASEFSEPAVAEALRALAWDYLAHAVKLHHQTAD